MSAITIRLDFPPKELSPNFHTKAHAIVWSAKSRYRYACQIDARNARDGRTTYPLTGPLEASAVFYVTRGRGPDVDNALASLKAGIDGIADAGVIANDRDIVSWSASVVKGLRREVQLIIKERPI